MQFPTPAPSPAGGQNLFLSFPCPTPGQGPTPVMPRTGFYKFLFLKNGGRPGNECGWPQTGAGRRKKAKYTLQACGATGPPRAKPAPSHSVSNTIFCYSNLLSPFIFVNVSESIIFHYIFLLKRTSYIYLYLTVKVSNATTPENIYLQCHST